MNRRHVVTGYVPAGVIATVYIAIVAAGGSDPELVRKVTLPAAAMIFGALGWLPGLLAPLCLTGSGPPP